MDSFGAYLKAHREKKGIRIEEIASITKIHPHALELLENNKWDALPPEPFIRGFIVAYAKYVGLPTAEVMDKYHESTGVPAVPVPTAPPISRTPMHSPAKPSVHHPAVGGTPGGLITQVRLPSGARMITVASLIGVVGLAALLINVGRESEKPAPVPEPAPVATIMTPEVPAVEEDRKVATSATPNAKATAAVAPAAAPKPALKPAPEAAAPAGNPQHEVVVEGKERTWLKVVIDDSAPQEIFLGEGKSATYKALNKIKVVLGNSTGSKVTYNGKEVEGTQFMGTIRSYKFPSNARFPQDIPSKRTPSNGESASVTE